MLTRTTVSPPSASCSVSITTVPTDSELKSTVTSEAVTTGVPTGIR
jgi:hypothetical protein